MKSMLLVFFIDKFALGVLNIVFSLIFLSRGVSPSNLAFLMSIFSFIIIFLEIPTGILSDMIGRKKTYVISRFFNILALLIFCMSEMPLISIGFIFYGMSQAFESGTIKALYFENYLTENGKESMADASKKINFVQTLGLILGVVIGGLLSDLRIAFLPVYSLNIFVTIISTGISLSVVFYKIEDKVSLVKEKIPIKVRLKSHILESVKLFFNARKMKIILIGTFFMGLLLFSIETYWQPRIQVITSPKTFNMYLIIISFINYFAATIGNFIGSFLLKGKNNIDNVALSIYYKFYILIFLSMLLLAFTNKAIFFLMGVFFIYTTLGVMTICEDTILNINTPDDFRSTLMGMQSLILQMGMIIGTQIAGFILLNNSIEHFWLIIAIILACSFVVIIIIGRGMKNE